MTSPLYLLIERHVEDAWVRLEREQITPWVFMTAGPLFEIRDFYGNQISYQGIEFEGSPRHVFWGRYIEPFLEDLVDRVVKQTLQLAAEKRQDGRVALPEVAGLLKAVIRRTYSRMADIDRRLRGKGFPENVTLRNIASEVGQMESLVDRRIATELSTLRRRHRINEFYNDHPFLF